MTAVFTGLSEGLVLLDENDVLRICQQASVNIFGNELAGKSFGYAVWRKKTVPKA